MGFTWKGLGKAAKKVGKSAGKVWEKVDDVALTGLGFAMGGPAGAALGAAAARGIGDGKFNAGQTLKHGVIGGAAGLAGGALGLQGGQGLGALGKSVMPALGKAGSGLKAAGSKVGSGLLGAAKGAVSTNGEFDMQKLMGLGLTGAAFKGQRDDNAAASKYNAGNAAMRQALMDKLSKSPDYSALMERITARPNYNFN